MDAKTKKVLIIGVIAIFALNLIDYQSKKNFEKAVINIIKNNPDLAQAPPAPPPPGPEEQLKQQLADKVNVDIGDTPVKGSKNARIKLIVFSDFQCPFSKRGADIVNELTKKYGSNLMYVYKNLPLPFHTEAMPSAKAALAAGKQGKFYEYHDKLFENQEKLGEDLYVRVAKELGLDMNKFNADRNSKEIEDKIQADLTQANSLGFNGTPGFALNGVKVLGAYPLDHFEKIINALGLG